MRWQRIIHLILRAGLIASVLYVVVVFIERAREPKAPPKLAVLPLSPDYYVVPPKSHVRSLADVRVFVGKPLWVREGYRWSCTPGPGVLGPMEKLVPTRAFRKGEHVWLKFVRDGRSCAIQVSAGDSFFLDEIFLIKDPHEVYKDWTPEAWKKIEARRIEPGMTETQITFALGYGLLVKDLSRQGDPHRVVDYTAGDKRMRVVYAYGVAKQVEPLPAQ